MSDRLRERANQWGRAWHVFVVLVVLTGFVLFTAFRSGMGCR